MMMMMAKKVVVWTVLFLVGGLSFIATTDSQTDAMLEVVVNGLANCTMDSTEQMFEEEVNELLSQLDCEFNFTINTADSSAILCDRSIYSANISVVNIMDYTQQVEAVCQAMNCLRGSNVTGVSFFTDTLNSLSLSPMDKLLCDTATVTGSPSNTTSELLSVFIRDLIIVAASAGGGSAVILTVIVIIVFCVKTARYSYRKSRSWTLSNSDMDAQNFVPYNPDLDDTTKSIPMGRVRDGPLPTPPPPDTPRPTERYVDVNVAPPPPVAPPLSGDVAGFSGPTQSLVSPPSAPPMPSAPPPPPPLPPVTTCQPSSRSVAILPPPAVSNPMTTLTAVTPSTPPRAVNESLATTKFVEDIYDVYDVDEEDLHKKTKEMENLLASMGGDPYIDHEVTDEYIEVNPAPRRVSNSATVLPDYVNFNPGATQTSLSDVGALAQDEYVDMSSSLRRDQQFIKYTSNEDMYI